MDNSQQTREEVTRLISQLAQRIGIPVSPAASTSTSMARPVANITIQPGLPSPWSTPERSGNRNSTGSTSTAVTSELSRIFSPYPRNRTSRAVGIPTQRSTRQSRPTLGDWSGRFCCLAGPHDDRSPTLDRMLELKTQGLGDGVITLGKFEEGAELKSAIVQAFPKIEATDIVIMRAISGGKGKPLIRLSNLEDIPSVRYLRATRSTLFYVQPKNNIVNEAPAAVELADVIEIRRILGNTEQTQQSTEGESEFLAGQTSEMEEELEMLTLVQFREHLYLQHPGNQYLAVGRENFLEKLLGVYKDPSFNLLRKPKVEFLGESGADIGALSREFFWTGFTALVNERINGIPLFEGEDDHKLPSTDARLLRSGIFKSIGKFMAHAAIHCGVSFIGLSPAASEYLIQEVSDGDSPLTIVEEDVPEVSVRESLQKLKQMRDGSIPDEESLSRIQSVAAAAEFTEGPSKENAIFLYDHLLYHIVVEKRIRQLDAIREAFLCTGISKFLTDRKFLVADIFPRKDSVEYPASIVKAKMRVEGELIREDLLSTFTEFVDKLETEPNGIRNLICCWTGWPFLSENALVIRFEEDVEFCAHACFNEIKVPMDFTPAKLLESLNLLTKFSTVGFGAV